MIYYPLININLLYLVFDMHSEAATERVLKNGVLKNFAKFTCIGSCRSEAYNFIKKDTPTQMFPVNFAKCLRTPFS